MRYLHEMFALHTRPFNQYLDKVASRVATCHSNMAPLTLVLFLFFSSLQLRLFPHSGAVARHHGGVSLRSQQAALLRWKSTLRGSPALESWRQGTSPCSSNWTGVACGVAVRRGHRASPVAVAVTEISLRDAGIHGRLGELNFSALPC